MVDSAVYSDCFEHFEAALNDPRGVRIPFPEEGDANNHRTRLHKARRADRQLNRETYTPQDKLFGRSAYDRLRVRIKAGEGQWWVYIEHSSAGEPQLLSEVEDERDNQPVASDSRPAGGETSSEGACEVATAPARRRFL